MRPRYLFTSYGTWEHWYCDAFASASLYECCKGPLQQTISTPNTAFVNLWSCSAAADVLLLLITGCRLFSRCYGCFRRQLSTWERPCRISNWNLQAGKGILWMSGQRSWHLESIS